MLTWTQQLSHTKEMLIKHSQERKKFYLTQENEKTKVTFLKERNLQMKDV